MEIKNSAEAGTYEVSGRSVHPLRIHRNMEREEQEFQILCNMGVRASLLFNIEEKVAPYDKRTRNIWEAETWVTNHSPL